MDSMTEMFYDESSGILRSMRKNLLGGQGSDYYGQEVVQELFRGVHTLKADSAMMLYENMSDLSNAMESLLYCFRGEDKKITDVTRFDRVITEYLDFFEQETGKLAEGKTPDGIAEELENEIREFTAEVTAEMPEEEVKAYRKEISKPRRQIFYIASASNEDMPVIQGKSEKKEKAGIEADAIGEASDIDEEPPKGNKKKYMISEEDRERVCQSARNLLRMIDNMEYALGNGDSGTFTRSQLERLKEIQKTLEMVKKELVNTNFAPVARKLEIAVDEMSEKLDKPVKLLVKGEDTPVDSERREKISSALIHIIRNSMDHGIEDRETRERLGKSPMGLIKLRFSTEDGHLKVSVKDDGAGIDKSRILKSAQEKNLLSKAPEEYTEREIYNLMLISGVTTKSVANEYSGRGVGMDVINHNVADMGGKLKISSKKGLGTTITMKF